MGETEVAAGASGRDRRPVGGFLAAVGVSSLGTRMSFLALPWFVLTTTGSATRTGLVAFSQMAPYVGVQAFGGPFVDRLGARRMSVAADVVACAAMGSVPLLSAVHHLSLALLCVLVALAGASRGAGDGARDVLVPGVTEIAGMSIERSSGLYDGAIRLASLVALPSAGALVTVVSPLTILAVDAATFAASALLVGVLVPVRAQPPAPAALEGVGAAEASYLESLREGFAYLAKDRLLMAIAAMILVTNFVDQAGGAVLSPEWAHTVAHSSVALGLIGGVASLGAFAGNALTTWLGPRLPRHATYAVGFLLAGAPRYLALALLSNVPVVLAVMLVGGFGAGGINPVLGAVEYERVPRHLQARVLGAVGASAWAGIPFGSLVAGLVVSAAGLRPALLAAAVLYGVTTLCPLVFPSWREMNLRPGAGAGADGGGGGDAARPGAAETAGEPPAGPATTPA